MSTPILEAEAVIQQSIFDAFSPLMDDYQHNGYARCYWMLAEPNAPKPYMVVQPQTPIERWDRIGDNGATGLITIKATAATQDAARELLATVAPGMDDLTADDYEITARYVRSPTLIPRDGAAWQVAHTYRITLRRT